MPWSLFIFRPPVHLHTTSARYWTYEPPLIIVIMITFMFHSSIIGSQKLLRDTKRSHQTGFNSVFYSCSKSKWRFVLKLSDGSRPVFILTIQYSITKTTKITVVNKQNCNPACVTQKAIKWIIKCWYCQRHCVIGETIPVMLGNGLLWAFWWTPCIGHTLVLLFVLILTSLLPLGYQDNSFYRVHLHLSNT